MVIRPESREAAHFQWLMPVLPQDVRHRAAASSSKLWYWERTPPPSPPNIRQWSGSGPPPHHAPGPGQLVGQASLQQSTLPCFWAWISSPFRPSAAPVRNFIKSRVSTPFPFGRGELGGFSGTIPCASALRSTCAVVDALRLERRKQPKVLGDSPHRGVHWGKGFRRRPAA